MKRGYGHYGAPLDARDTDEKERVAVKTMRVVLYIERHHRKQIIKKLLMIFLILF